MSPDTLRAVPQPDTLPAWAALQRDAERLRTADMRALFAADPDRPKRFSLTHDGLWLDVSKQRIDATAHANLLALAEQRQLGAAIAALYDGACLNPTEGRAVLHMAMRGGAPFPASEAEAVSTNLARVDAFAARLRAGELRGATGEPIRTVVNIGIGGSDLGPRMAAEALANGTADEFDVRFIANIDPDDLDQTLTGLDPARTLFVVSSKSFSTTETLTNASAARAWLAAALGAGADLSLHFAAVSNAVASAERFGIAPDRIFSLPEWVGGRYSVWSAIGLPLRVLLGPRRHEEFLAGARAMDTHFRTAPLAANLPLTLALLGIWNASFLGVDSLAVLPYAHRLRHLPDYLQQLEMESNGKRARLDGSSAPYPTAPVLWGGAGTLGQHAFHQLLYQGTRTVAIDFVVPVGPDSPARRALVDNALAQSAALMLGRTAQESAAALAARGLNDAEVARLTPHLVCPGNQPSTTLLLPRVDPYRLGQLLALYEHKVFAIGWLLGLNSFDQYGVELGKEMARALDGAAPDASTAALMSAARGLRQA